MSRKPLPPFPKSKKRLLAAGCNVPIIGDFHYNGHGFCSPSIRIALIRSTNYRINPGNVGAGQRPR